MFLAHSGNQLAMYQKALRARLLGHGFQSKLYNLQNHRHRQSFYLLFCSKQYPYRDLMEYRNEEALLELGQSPGQKRHP